MLATGNQFWYQKKKKKKSYESLKTARQWTPILVVVKRELLSPRFKENHKLQLSTLLTPLCHGCQWHERQVTERVDPMMTKEEEQVQ